MGRDTNQALSPSGDEHAALDEYHHVLAQAERLLTCDVSAHSHRINHGNQRLNYAATFLSGPAHQQAVADRLELAAASA